MKVITNPINNIPVNAKSHTLGWAQLWRDQLGAYIDNKCTPNVRKASTVYIDHGANFGGTLNLFGGANKEVYDKLNIIASCKDVISLDWDMPDYGAMLKKRLGAKTTYEGITEDWCDLLSKRFKNVKSLKQEELDLNNVIVGDSHTLSFCDRGDMVFRNDGKTLHGALKAGLSSLIRDNNIHYNRITFCLGSIDIRHHLLRHELNIDVLIDSYYEQAMKYSSDSTDVWFTAPVPVEFEGRRIPKSGFFKKEPFYGSCEQRRDVTDMFISALYKRTSNIVQPPSDWYSMDPQKYAETYMEHGSSFHIAPPFYRKNNWGATVFAT